jgi:hypothetical protein
MADYADLAGLPPITGAYAHNRQLSPGLDDAAPRFVAKHRGARRTDRGRILWGAVMALRAWREDGAPLSDHERRVLSEIEQGLIAVDPKLAESIGRHRWRIPRLVWAVGACFGVGFVVLGLITGDGIGALIAVVGFVLIVANCCAALGSRRRRRRPPGLHRPHR